MTRFYDVVVLGTGNAGMGAAGVARAAGKTVAMVESRDVGGTCPLRGCVPKKVLVAAAQALHQIDLAPAHHIAVGKPKLDWGKLIARERTFVDGVAQAFAESLEKRGIDLFKGEARFTGRNTIEVDGETLKGAKIVIATGSKPRHLPISGAEHMITSEDILEMTSLPESLVFIGGGVVALEFSHVLARAGTTVTILEALPRLLPRLDADAVAEVRAESARIGIDIRTGVTVKEIAPAGNRLQVRFTHEGEERVLATAHVANGAGRVADVEDLDLDAGGIDHDGPNIAVNDALQSVSNADVYVAGDALSTSAQLSPVATYEGRLVGDNIVNGTIRTPDYSHIPAAVHTVPALAVVGLSEEEATARGLKFSVKANDLKGWRSSMTHAETAAYSKVLIEDGSDRILGAHLVGHGGEEIIHLFAFAMQHGLTAPQLSDTVFAYPTFASDIKHMV